MGGESENGREEGEREGEEGRRSWKCHICSLVSLIQTVVFPYSHISIYIHKGVFSSYFCFHSFSFSNEIFCLDMFVTFFPAFVRSHSFQTHTNIFPFYPAPNHINLLPHWLNSSQIELLTHLGSALHTPQLTLSFILPHYPVFPRAYKMEVDELDMGEYYRMSYRCLFTLCERGNMIWERKRGLKGVCWEKLGKR